MNARRTDVRRAITIACLLLAGTASARSLPERPAKGEKPDFHVVLGAGWLALDLNAYGAAGVTEPHGERWGLLAGVGWTWADRLRLQAELGGWELSSEATCGRASAIVLVPIAGGLSVLGSLGAAELSLANDAYLEAFEVGAGAAYTAHLAKRFSLEGRYTYLRQRYFEDEIDGVTIHPDATGHLLGLLLILDL
jgi:hypothetical protein